MKDDELNEEPTVEEVRAVMRETIDPARLRVMDALLRRLLRERAVREAADRWLRARSSVVTAVAEAWGEMKRTSRAYWVEADPVSDATIAAKEAAARALEVAIEAREREAIVRWLQERPDSVVGMIARQLADDIVMGAHHKIQIVDRTPPGATVRLEVVELSEQHQASRDVGAARLPGPGSGRK